MKLKCKINGIEYPLVQGNTFAEEDNETLDSAAIIISGVSQIKDLLPFDDVFIYKGNFNGYPINHFETPFYRHLLVDQYTETLVNKKDKIYEYKIELMSETKKLETVQLPNRSATQPIVIDKKRSVWSYLNEYVDLYSPLYKVANKLIGKWYLGDIEFKHERLVEKFRVKFTCTDEEFSLISINHDQRLIQYDGLVVYHNGYWSDEKYSALDIFDDSITIHKKELLKWLKNNYANYETTLKIWDYEQKYTLDESLKEIFDKVYCPDFTANAPSLKDALTQLMLVKDMLPYVKDDVIYGLDISARNGVFNFDESAITDVISSMSSSNYANNLRRNYSNALSQEKSARRVEYLGFRNSESALMTLEDMKLETQFPIYKVNKVYMCYYKRGNVNNTGGVKVGDRTFLCKQDISKLVLQNTTRNLIYNDWDDFENVNKPSGNNAVDEMAKFKMCTVGYDIGGKSITGWGTKYDYPKGWWQGKKTYLQNIVEIMDEAYPYGIYTYGYIAKQGSIPTDDFYTTNSTFKDNFVNPAKNPDNVALGLKGIFFIVDYDAFYDGAVVHSKDDDMRDDITINDNSSSSLTLLEKDGLFQKEKLNRFGNKAVEIHATYKDINEMQKLGSVYDDDIIIYHREYSIYDNFVNVVYYGTKDYVLKNYYVSVYAKHRTYNLMSYGESVNRAENRKMYLMMSKHKSYFENDNKKFSFSAFSVSPLELILSAFKPSEEATTIDFIKTPYKVNMGYITHNDKKYLADVNGFVNGYSLCFNLKMFDNVSAGVYIKKFEPDIKETAKDFTGSVQDWYLLTDDIETGYTDIMGFYVAHLDTEEYFYDKVFEKESDVKDYAYPRLFMLPKIDENFMEQNTNIIGDAFHIRKDNKEVIDMTYQLEPITNDHDVLFSQWLMKLSDLLSTYNKVDIAYPKYDSAKGSIIANIKYASVEDNTTAARTPLIILELNASDFNKLDKDIMYPISNTKITFGNQAYPTTERGKVNYYDVEFSKINKIVGNDIEMEVHQTIKLVVGSAGETVPYKNDAIIHFHNITSFGTNQVPEGKMWFSNAQSFGGNTPNSRLFPDNELTYYNGQIFAPIPLGKYNFTTKRTILVTDNIDDANETETLVAVYGESKEYLKNMFIVESPETLRKTLVYDEYAKGQLDVLIDREVQDMISYQEGTNGIPKLHILLSNTPSTTKSVQYWYLDEESQSYKFVFGVNVDVADRERGYIDIYLSLISTRDTRVYDDKHNVIGEINNYADANNPYNYGEEQYYK